MGHRLTAGRESLELAMVVRIHLPQFDSATHARCPLTAGNLPPVRGCGPRAGHHFAIVAHAGANPVSRSRSGVVEADPVSRRPPVVQQQNDRPIIGRRWCDSIQVDSHVVIEGKESSRVTVTHALAGASPVDHPFDSIGSRRPRSRRASPRSARVGQRQTACLTCRKQGFNSSCGHVSGSADL